LSPTGLGQDLDVSEKSGTPKSSILIGFSIVNHPFWGTSIFGNTHLEMGFRNDFVCECFSLVPGRDFEEAP